MFNMAAKYARLGKEPKEPKGANPFIDREGYFEELDARERVFNLRLAEQKKAACKSL